MSENLTSNTVLVGVAVKKVAAALLVILAAAATVTSLKRLSCSSSSFGY